MGAEGAGYVGPLPGRAGLVAIGLDEAILSRWERWFELAAAHGGPGGEAPLHPDRPTWRLAARAGVFGPRPLAGCFRLAPGRGGAQPCAVLSPGDLPDPADPWFDAAAALARDAAEGRLDTAGVARRLDRLPAPAAAGPLSDPLADAAAVAWRDDWEVQELRFPAARDLAAFPLRLAALSSLGEEAAA